MDYTNFIGRFVGALALAIGSFELGKFIGYHDGVKDGIQAKRRFSLSRTPDYSKL